MSTVGERYDNKSNVKLKGFNPSLKRPIYICRKSERPTDRPSFVFQAFEMY